MTQELSNRAIMQLTQIQHDSRKKAWNKELK